MFREYTRQEQGLSDLLNYAHLVEEGIVLNKDGAFLTTYKFQGPDINSATTGELDALCQSFSRMLTFLEDGWMIHVDEIRVPSLIYPARGAFPDTVSALIDEERRQQYEAEGEHYENLQFLTFVWKFPIPVIKTSRHWFIEGLPKEEGTQSLSKLLILFKETVERCLGLISTLLILEHLNSGDLLSFLNTCITGELLPVAVPPAGCYVDAVLGRRPLIGGYLPKIGNKYFYTLTLTGYLNDHTIPGLLEDLNTYTMVYRWSNRFIPLSDSTAEREIKRVERNWHNKVKGIIGLVKEAFSGHPSTKVNQDAVDMEAQTRDALAVNSNHSVRFGYWTSVLVLMHEEIAALDQAEKVLKKFLEQKGFTCNQEDVNAVEAWRGSVPGHGSCNVRRLFVDSLNLACVLPLHSIWAGAPFSSTSSLLPPESPPVLYASTTGKTPFRFHLDVGDVGHQLVVGPTGSGKSTYLGFLIAQFLRYEGAKIWVFDKDYSHRALTAALSGHHYDIGQSDNLAFCPLAHLETDAERIRAEQWLENLVELQNVKITPDIRSAIHTALQTMASDSAGHSRNITVFQSLVQHTKIREALQFYTLEGQFKLLDAIEDSLQAGYLQTFEMGWLLNQKPEIYLPVLLYVFDQLEAQLDQRESHYPTLIILEEAWQYSGHPVFARKLRDWFKTLRKKNARLVFTTQSLSDLYDPTTKTLTSVTATILESCPTRLFLPNPKMESETRELYQKMGLNERQIELIQQSLPKKHYYVTSPEGNRLIDLGFTQKPSLPLAFVGLSKEQSKRLLEMQSQEGEEWVYYWLKAQGLNQWANYWRQMEEEKQLCVNA